jgi:hypothetical protein
VDRVEVSLRFAFFAGFKRDSPGYLGDPYGCPRQMDIDRTSDFWLMCDSLNGGNYRCFLSDGMFLSIPS